LTEFFRQVGGVENCLKFFSRGAAFMDFEPASGTKNGDTPSPIPPKAASRAWFAKMRCKIFMSKSLDTKILKTKSFQGGGWALWAPASAAVYVDAD
jgi:hypothetical protein